MWGSKDGALRCRALGLSGCLVMRWGIQNSEKEWGAHPRVWNCESKLGNQKAEGPGCGVTAGLGWDWCTA